MTKKKVRIGSSASSVSKPLGEMKLTRQRECIADIFFGRPLHRTAEEIWREAKDIEPRVSLATVYRTLKLFHAKGLARAHEFGDGLMRFEPELSGDTHHDHLICQQCKKIVEFFDSRIEALQETVAGEHGFKVLHHRMELYGLCQKCQMR
jgi:Fur family ferric uptake transcriptional regulator